MRVFVLGTGRCGTMTFVRACEQFDNFGAGHETNSRLVGSRRLDYPNSHVEADNRLSWMLGALAERYDDTDVLYVHLRRDPGEVARSFERRWGSSNRASIIQAFAHGIIQRRPDWPAEDLGHVCRFYVDVVTANISEFIATRPSIEMWLPQLRDDFPVFMERIGATGPIDEIQRTLSEIHNQSQVGP